MIGSKGRNWEAGVSGTGPRQKGREKKEKKKEKAAVIKFARRVTLS